MPALLAPVPIIHLEDGISVFQEHGKVAFGSDYVEMFDPGVGIAPGTKVYIYASKSGHDGKTTNPWIGKVTHSATLIGVAGSRGGKCPWPELRGERAARDDTEFGYFWQLADLTELKPPRFFSSFKSDKTKKALLGKPERALLVVDDV